MEPKLPPSGGLLPRPVLQFSIYRKDKHSLTELHIDVGEQAQDFGASDLANLGTFRRKAECA